MASEVEVRALKSARAEFAKRGIDTGQADLRMRHGIIQIRGLLRPVRGADCGDMKTTVEHCCKALRGQASIKDVIVDCQLRNM